MNRNEPDGWEWWVNNPSKAQFRRRASAVPNSIAIWFDCDTAEKQLWFRRRARVESNLEFTDTS